MMYTMKTSRERMIQSYKKAILVDCVHMMTDDCHTHVYNLLNTYLSIDELIDLYQFITDVYHMAKVYITDNMLVNCYPEYSQYLKG